jgi:quercetin dioxygenase-like cupin family protein
LDPELRSIAIYLPDGEQLGEHQTYERAYLVVASGAVDVWHSDGEITTGGPGYVWQFEPQERRSVRASGGGARIVLILAPWPGEGHTAGGQ